MVGRHVGARVRHLGIQSTVAAARIVRPTPVRPQFIRRFSNQRVRGLIVMLMMMPPVLLRARVRIIRSHFALL